MFFDKHTLEHVESASIRFEIAIPLLRSKLGSPPDGTPAYRELADVIDSLPSLIASFDHDGRLLLINRSGVETLGGSDDRWSKLIFSDLYPAPHAERMVAQALPEAWDRGYWSGRASLLTADGRPLEMDQQLIAQMKDGVSSRAFTLIATPATLTPVEHRQAILSNRRESVAARSISVVHDMNNLLGPVIAYADLSRLVLDPNHEAQKYLAQIDKAAQQGQALSQKLIELTLGQSQATSLVDMGEVVGDIVRWLRVTRPDLDIHVSGQSPPTPVLGDPVDLQQLVLNLGRNAIEALSDRPGRIELAVDTVPSAEPLRDERHVRIRVRDDGRGIDADALSRIFEPFFSTRPDAPGLGLYVAREVAKAHRGELTVTGTKPHGTVASVSLPLASGG